MELTRQFAEVVTAGVAATTGAPAYLVDIDEKAGYFELATEAYPLREVTYTATAPLPPGCTSVDTSWVITGRWRERREILPDPKMIRWPCVEIPHRDTGMVEALVEAIRLDLASHLSDHRADSPGSDQ